MNILVTGATGIYGANVAKRLLDECHTVIGIMHDKCPITSSKLLKIDDLIIWTFGDVLDFNFLTRVVADYEIDEIYHFAAMPIVKRCPEAPLPVYLTNIIGTCNVLEAARRRDCKVLYMSTDKAYGYAGDIPYKEDFPLVGLGVYDSSKSCGDLITRAYNYIYGLKTVVVRSCNIYGPGDLNWRIIPNTIRRCLLNQPPVIFDGIKHIREYIYVDDATHALSFLMENIDKIEGQAFNVGSGQSFSDEEIIQKINKHFPNIKPIIRPPLPYMSKEIPYQRLDCTKIHNLGWKPKNGIIDFDTGLEKTINWYKEHKDLLPAPPLK